jgi:hypothetical protein
MDRTVLVRFDTEAGQEIVDALDNADLSPKVALWAKLDEYGDPRLILASDKFDDDSLRVIDTKVFDVLIQSHIDLADTYAVLVFRMEDTFIRELRERYATQAGIRRVRRLADQLFGGKFIEDSFVYRIE